MKKTSMRFMALVAAVLPMLMLGSCDDKEEVKPIEPKEEGTEYTPDEAYIRQAWMIYDSIGTMVDTKYGRILDESTPTIRSIGKDNLQDAKEHFLNVLCPPDAKVSADGDDMTVPLNDTLGVEKNKLIFKAVNDGSTLARVTLEKPIGIEKFLTELDYRAKSSDIYSVIDNNCPFQEGRIYYHNNHNYLCLRIPARGDYGILVSDVSLDGKEVEIKSNTERASAKATANYPDTGVFAEIQDILEKQNSLELWQKLAATTSCVRPNEKDSVDFGNLSVSDFKKRIYWTSVLPNDNEDIRTWSLFEGQKDDVEPGFDDEKGSFWFIEHTCRYELSAYAFYFGQTENGMPGALEQWNIYRLASPNCSCFRDIVDLSPSIDSFERNELVENNAGNIKE